MSRWSRLLPVLLILASLALEGCRTPGKPLKRRGDEIVAAGQLFHTGTPVVTWMDPGGYDAYRVERRFSPLAESSWEKSRETVKDLGTPNRYGMRTESLSPAEIERVRGGGWDLPTLQRVVDQFVIHYDVCGFSKVCFKILHDHRGLSVHFMLDVDGTIYQTLDLKERGRHATIANDRSIGIEIANIGAYAPAASERVFATWYHTDASGRPTLSVPPSIGDPLIRTPGFVGHPARPKPVAGVVQGQDLLQYDFTPQQYAALIKLTAALSRIFPKIKCDYPRDASGKLVPHRLTDAELKAYGGVIGHFHIQQNKIDPGPAFDWDKVIGGAQKLLPAK